MSRINVENIKTIKLDENDKKILYLVSRDARMTFNEISKNVRLSPDSVKYRIERMIKNGIIVKFIPDVSFRQFGLYKFSVFFQIIEITKEKENNFINYLKSNKNILAIRQYTDRYDFEIVIVAKDIEEYDQILNKIINDYSEIIDDVIMFQQIRSYKSVFLPENFSKIQKKARIPRKRLPQEVKIDKLDIQILSELNKDARMSSYIIAQNLNTSLDTVLYRIKKMQQNDVIHRFVTTINFSMLGYSWYTFLLRIKSFTKEKEAELREFVKKHNNIIRCVRGIGEWEIIIYMVAFNQPEFHKAVNEFRTRFRDIIKTYDTLLGYKEHKFEEFERCLFDVLKQEGNEDDR